MSKRERREMDLCVEALATCGGFNLRRASRAVTQLFDQALESTGLRSTQVVILMTIVADDSPSIAQLARELVMDPSTLTRNLRPLLKQGLLDLSHSGRGKAKKVALTDKGREKLQELLPIWNQTQRQFVKHVGARRWNSVRNDLRALVEALQGPNGRVNGYHLRLISS